MASTRSATPLVRNPRRAAASKNAVYASEASKANTASAGRYSLFDAATEGRCLIFDCPSTMPALPKADLREDAA